MGQVKDGTGHGPARILNFNWRMCGTSPDGRKIKNDAAWARGMAGRFAHFCDMYSSHFIQQGMNSVDHARHYVSGLLGTQRRKNIETIENDVEGSDYQGMEQFLSSSPWDHEGLMEAMGPELNRYLGGQCDSALYIDESSFLKKGVKSVGVERQWSGRAGKLENCQVAVFAALGCGSQVGLADFRLYLPKSWVEDKKRCEGAKIPSSQCRLRTKHQLALELVQRSRERGLQFGWVGFDSLYGSCQSLVNALEDAGEKFVGDVHVTNKVWTREPVFAPKREGQGRPRKTRALDKNFEGEYVNVEQLAQRHFESQSRWVVMRPGHKGPIEVRVWHRTVWCWEPKWDCPKKRTLIVREDRAGDFKYTLTNLTDIQDPQRLAYIQGQRFWIEHAFQEAKSQLGMAQYQVRVWRGWHHHMALVALAMLFTLGEQSTSKPHAPLLSVRDLTELLDHYLPRRSRDETEILRQIQKRHRKRQEDMDRRKRNHRSRIKNNLTK